MAMDRAPVDDAAQQAELRRRQARTWPAEAGREAAYPIGRVPLTEHLRHWARETPEAPAVIWYGRALSYAELDDLSDRFSTLLKQAGIGRGDRVAVFAPNCPQFHIAFFGILKAGAVHCPISPMSTAHELDYMLKDTGAAALVALDGLMEVVRAAPAAAGLRRVWTCAMADFRPDAPSMQMPDMALAAPLPAADATALAPALAAAEPARDRPADLNAVAALNYTGGTTGMPKGCVHTQGDMVDITAANWGVTRGTDAEEASTVFLSFFPEFWIAGENAALLRPVFTGRPVVLMARWDPLAFLQAIAAHRVTHTVAVVDGMLELMERPDFAAHDLSSLRSCKVVSFIKKLDRDIRARWRELTGTTLSEAAWGMTETHTSNTFTTGLQNDDYDLKARPVFVGLPCPGNEFRIADFDSGETLPLGEEGEIRFRGPSLMKRYWNRPDATAEALEGGWLRTGDVGVIGPDGCLHYLGRRKEMLKVRGMSVFPAELEAALGRHEMVQGSGVIGRQDARAGQVPVAFVALAPGAGPDRDANAEALRAWLAERVAAYKLPEIRILDALPLTATGKVKKTELEKLLEPAA